MDSRWIVDLKGKVQTIKLLEANIGECLHALGVQIDSINRAQKAIILKAKIHKLLLFIERYLWRWETVWENICISYIHPTKVSSIEHTKNPTQHKDKENPTGKRAKDRSFAKEDIQKNNKNIQKRVLKLVFSQMQMKTKENHSTSTRIKIKMTDNPVISKDVEQMKLLALLVWVYLFQPLGKSDW